MFFEWSTYWDSCWQHRESPKGRTCRYLQKWVDTLWICLPLLSTLLLVQALSSAASYSFSSFNSQIQANQQRSSTHIMKEQGEGKQILWIVMPRRYNSRGPIYIESLNNAPWNCVISDLVEQDWSATCSHTSLLCKHFCISLVGLAVWLTKPLEGIPTIRTSSSLAGL